MKKILAFAAVAAAVSFTACTGNKTNATSEPDSLCCQADSSVECCQKKAECPKGAASNIISALAESLEKGDAEGVKGIAAQVGEAVAKFLAAGDEGSAQTYTALISNFVAENYEKLQDLGVATAVSDALANVQGLPEGVLDIAKSAATGVKSDALNAIVGAISGKAAEVEGAANEAVDAAAQKVDEVKAAAEAAPEAAKAAASEAIDNAAAAAKSKLGL